EPQLDRLDPRRRARPVGQIPLHQPGVGEDVDEDVLGTLGLRLVPVVVHVLEIAGGQRRRHDERRIGMDFQFGQLGAHLDDGCAHVSGSQAYSVQLGPLSVSGRSMNITRTGMPICTAAGSTLRSSPSIRTPSSSSTSAMTNGRVRPGTFGAWCTTKLNTVPRPPATT